MRYYKIRLYLIIIIFLGIFYIFFGHKEKKPEVEPNIDYSKNELQTLFMELNERTNEDWLKTLIKKYDLKYTVTQYNTDSKKRKGSLVSTNYYTISKTEIGSRKFSYDGDYVEVQFDDINKVIFAEYVYKRTEKYMPYRSVKFYAENSYNADKGYYINMHSILEKRDKGVEFKRGDRISKTSLFKYNTAEDGINELIKAAHTNWEE